MAGSNANAITFKPDTVRMSDNLDKFTKPAKTASLKAERRNDIVLPAYKFDDNVDSQQSKAMDKEHNLYLVETSNGEMVQAWMTPSTFARYQKLNPDTVPDQYASSLNLSGLTRGVRGPKGTTAQASSPRISLFGPKPLRGVPIRLSGARLDKDSNFQAVMGMRRNGGQPIKAVRIRSDLTRTEMPAAKAKLAKAGYIPAKTQSGQLVYIQRSDKNAWIAAGGLVKE